MSKKKMNVSRKIHFIYVLMTLGEQEAVVALLHAFSLSCDQVRRVSTSL